MSKVLEDPDLMNQANAKAELNSSYLQYDDSRHSIVIVMPRDGTDVNYLKKYVNQKLKINVWISL